MASKKALLERMKKALNDAQEFAKLAPTESEDIREKLVSDFDWGFAPVVTDGKVNVGFKRSPMSAEEVYGAGTQGPINPNEYYKYQRITPEGKIERNIVYKDDYYTPFIRNGYVPFIRNGLKTERYTAKSDGGVHVSKAPGHEKRQRGPGNGAWLKDESGNWYKANREEGVEVPLEEAKKLRDWHAGSAFTGVDMRGKKNSTKNADVGTQNIMMEEARRKGIADKYQPYPDGETRFFHGALKDADRKRIQSIDDQKAFMRAQKYERVNELKRQIDELQSKIYDIESQYNKDYDYYDNMADGLKKYTDGNPWIKKSKD